MIEHAVMPSPLGDIILRVETDCLTGVFFHDQKHFPLSARPPYVQVEQSASSLVRQARDEIDEYLAGARHRFDLPLTLSGSDFQQRIWQQLARIPFGEVTTYGDMARALGLGRGHARAVGSAVGRNPISIIVPCHRVMAGNGTLNGYAGGLARKAHLLSLEGRS